MQNNSNYASSLAPELHGSVDYDFFGADDNEIGNKENLSSIEEVDALSRVSGDNSLKSGSIGELGGGKTNGKKEFDKSSLPPVPPAAASKSSSSASSPMSSPRQDSSIKSESTVRSGGFPPMSRGDSARPPSPTPPTSHASPSPHRVASAPRSVTPDPPRTPESPSSRESSPTYRSRGTSSASSPRSPRSPISPRSPRSPKSSDRSDRKSTSRKSRSVSPTSERSVTPETSRRSRRSSYSSKHSSDDDRTSPPTSRRSRRSTSSSSSSSSRSREAPDDKERRSSISSESDVTDVSPLSSHQHSPLGSPPPARKSSTQARVSNRTTGEELDDDRTNVELIMKAILELDKERQQCSKRTNQTMKQTGGRRPQEPQVPYRPYHSTINRIREQRRIEEENRQILKRLTQIRPSPNMRRDQQLREYQRQSTYGVVSTGKLRTGSKDLKPGSHRNASMSDMSRNPSGLKRRPASAKMGQERSASASSNGPRSSARPEWPSGW